VAEYVDASETNSLSQHVGTYAANSYITHGLLPLQNPTMNLEMTRLGRIAETMSTYNIVNEPTLGHYEVGNIVSSLYPPTSGAVWDEGD
jgi:hypothetical protein